MCPKESRSSVVSIKFSYKGDFLAVSFNNEYKLEDMLNDAEIQDEDNPLSKMTVVKEGAGKKQKSGKRDPSFALLYVNKLSERNPGVAITSKDPYVKM